MRNRYLSLVNKLKKYISRIIYLKENWYYVSYMKFE